MVDELSYFLIQPALHNWCNKGCVCESEKVPYEVVAADFLFHYRSSPLPSVHIHKENVWSASLNKIFPSFLNLTLIQTLILTLMVTIGRVQADILPSVGSP